MFSTSDESYKPIDPRSLINLNMKKMQWFLSRFLYKHQDCGCQPYLPNPSVINWFMSSQNIYWVSNTLLMNMTIFERGSFRWNQAKLKWCSNRVGRNPVWWMSFKKVKQTQRPTGRMPCYGRARDWSGIQAKKLQGLLATLESKKKYWNRIFPGSFREGMDLLRPCFWTFCLHKCERVTFSYFKPPNLCSLLWQP